MVERRHMDGVRVDQSFELQPPYLDQDLEAEQLDAARGRTETAADEHQEEKKTDRKAAPLRVVG